MDFRKVTPDSIKYLKSASIAEQAKLYIKLTKLHRLAAQNVWFNQQCKQKNLIPKYINLRTNTHSRASSIALTKARTIWLNEECKHWFSVRDNLKLHLKVLYSELSFKLHNVEFDLLDNKARDLASKLAHDKFLTQSAKLQSLTRERLENVSNTESENVNTESENVNTVSQNVNNAHQFHPRVQNLSNTHFSPVEISLLENGLKYNLGSKNTQKSLETLAVDAEIACVRGKQDFAVKYQVAAHIKKAFNVNNQPISQGSDIRIYKSIQERVNQNDLVVSKADKGNTIVILDRVVYNQKVNDIIQGDDFEQLNVDPTKKFTNDIKTATKSSLYIPPNTLRDLVPMNPRSPILYGLPKTHKANIPIRPVVSYIGAPAYKLAKHLNVLLRVKSGFTPQHSLKNSLDLIDKVKDVIIPPCAKLISLDVDSLFTNVPHQECLHILENMFEKQRLVPGEREDLISLTNLCMNQNYFRFNNQYYRQKEGLAMGSPLSPLMADIFMDNFESENVVKDPNILFYYRYVDDIIICWTGTLRQIDVFVNKLNSVHSKIKFKLELEENKSLNFLDINITRVNNKLEFQIYRKPTQTDIAIPSSSCHPIQHKLAAFRSYIHRLMTVPLSRDSYVKELNVIYQIAIANGYNKQLVDSLIAKKQRNNVRSLLYAGPRELINKYLGCLTYMGPISDKIANILRKNNLYVAFRTNQNIRHLCNGKDKIETDKKSGVYKLNCDNCNGVYVGQTGRNFVTRYKEHISAVRNNHPDKSHFAKHLLETGHELQSDNTYEVLHVCEKGFRLCVLEQLEILKHQNNQFSILNDQTNLVTSPLLRIFSKQSHNSDTGDVNRVTHSAVTLPPMDI